MSTPNERARAAALKAGKPTFRAQVIDYWPACVQCGGHIRIRGVGGRVYTCECQGVVWSPTGPLGWERSEP